MIERESTKQCYKAMVVDNDGYKYSMTISEIIDNNKKSKYKSNPFVESNYITYVYNHYEDIIVDNFDYKNCHSYMYFYCKKHMDKGIQNVKAKNIRCKNHLCIYCTHEYIGKCNSLTNDDVIEIKKSIEEQGCEYINTNIVERGTTRKRVVYFRCNKHNNAIQERAWNSIKKSRTPCLKCNREIMSYNLKGNIQDIIENVSFDEEKIEILGCYNNVFTKILCKCNYCNHQWYVTPNKLKQGRGCPNCAHISIGRRSEKNKEEVEKDLSKCCPTIEMTGDYNGAKRKTRFKCLTCGTEWEALFQNVKRMHTGCPLCRSSVGEFNIANYLDNNKVDYIRQFSFDDCKNEEPLRFDFYLPKYNCVVEFQGEQHFFPVNFTGHWTKEELNHQFEYTQLRDNIKRNFCKQKGIQMVEIPYWDKNNIEEYLSKVI